METRVGIGFDVHRFTPGRPLMIGGVRIPFPLGLQGHSDADVLLHAVADACLGAVGAGDIGRHFPDTDPKYAGMDSADILSRVARVLQENDATVLWIDAVVIAEQPRLFPYVPAIRSRIADLLSTAATRISIKGKTTEGLGFTGRKEGIAAQAVASVFVKNQLDGA